jgi:hypothetical protein
MQGRPIKPRIKLRFGQEEIRVPQQCLAFPVQLVKPVQRDEYAQRIGQAQSVMGQGDSKFKMIYRIGRLVN